MDGAQETLWLTQKQLAALFDKDVRTVNEHLKNIYKENGSSEESVGKLLINLGKFASH